MKPRISFLTVIFSVRKFLRKKSFKKKCENCKKNVLQAYLRQFHLPAVFIYESSMQDVDPIELTTWNGIIFRELV